MACYASWNNQTKRYEVDYCNNNNYNAPTTCANGEHFATAFLPNNDKVTVCVKNNMNEVLNSGGSVWGGIGSGGGGLPSGNIKINSNQNGVNISQGQTTLDKILQTSLSLAAIVRGRDYIPTTEQPQNNGYYNSNQGYTAEQIYALQNQNNNTGTGQQIENLIQNNKGLILLAVGAFVLLQMKPLSRK